MLSSKEQNLPRAYVVSWSSVRHKTVRWILAMSNYPLSKSLSAIAFRYRFLGDREYQPTFRTRIKEQFASSNDPIEAMLRQAQDRKDQEGRGRGTGGGGGEGPRALPGFALRRRSAHIAPGGTAAAAAAAEEAVEVKRHVQRLGQSAPSSVRAAAAAVSWEPLSLGALLDYKKSRSPTLTSSRPFRGGQVPWWAVDEARV